MDNQTINLMFVDDSIIICRILENIIKRDPKINIVTSAGNGQEAIDKLIINPSINVVLLDLEMPVMGGLEAIPKLININPKLKIIVVSSLAEAGSRYTIRALALGAADYVEKPNNKITLEQFSELLITKIHDVVTPKFSFKGLEKEPQKSFLLKGTAKGYFKPEIIAIASSTGGPRALMEILGNLSSAFLAQNTIVITQHIKDDFIDLLISNLNTLSNLKCKKPEDQEILERGYIYIAPSNVHLEIFKSQGKLVAHLSNSPPENFCRPSADPMFRSIAQSSLRCLAIVLTGIGSDGLEGAKLLVEKGSIVIAQDKETSVVWGMPGAVATANLCSAVLPLQKIASYIEKGII